MLNVPRLRRLSFKKGPAGLREWLSGRVLAQHAQSLGSYTHIQKNIKQKGPIMKIHKLYFPISMATGLCIYLLAVWIYFEKKLLFFCHFFSCGVAMFIYIHTYIRNYI